MVVGTAMGNMNMERGTTITMVTTTAIHMTMGTTTITAMPPPLQPLQQRYTRLLAQRKGQHDARLQEYRWMLEELRVSFFAQELRTPYPVSSKRLDKVWAQLQH